jgi:TatD DNase family protein
MKNFLIDSHCHIHYPDIAKDMHGIQARAQQNFVDYMITVATDHLSHEKIIPLIEEYSNVYGSIGIHPCDVHKIMDDNTDTLYEYLVKYASHDKIVALGETGLDFYVPVRDENNTPLLQEKFFRCHINVSKKTGLPVIIHTRDAEDDTIRILKNENFNNAVFHCFTGSQKLADVGLELGLYISFSGIITFKNCDELRNVVKNTPLDRILVETDSPYLSPEPVRKIKTNEPSHVLYVAQKIAEIHETSLENVMEVTTQNCINLFKKMNLS